MEPSLPGAHYTCRSPLLELPPLAVSTTTLAAEEDGGESVTLLSFFFRSGSCKSIEKLSIWFATQHGSDPLSHMKNPVQ